MSRFKALREFMKSNFGNWDDALKSDQELKLPQPPLQKPARRGARCVDLPAVDETTEALLKKNNLLSTLLNRKSTRAYAEAGISLEELSFLLYATQGVKSIKGNQYATIRTVPSAGARHPFETYIVVQRVDGLDRGVYRYLALSHQLEFMFEDEMSIEHIHHCALEQSFVANCAVTFIWSCIPYRGEWRYLKEAHKAMLLDAGHVCQNLYLASDAIGCGTCAIAAYDQKAIDQYLGLDGEEEFVVYMAPVGVLKTESWERDCL